MNNIAIVGTGPTAIYTLRRLIDCAPPCFITLYERTGFAGVGMPYNPEMTHAAMLANIASIELPAISETLLSWLKRQQPVFLALYGLTPETLTDRTFFPRVLLGGYFRDALDRIIADGQEAGFQIALRENTEVVDLRPEHDGIWLDVAMPDGPGEPMLHDSVVLATGHTWPDGAPDGQVGGRGWIASPWSGLLEAGVPAAPVGILGTSLSAIDVLVAVALQHGRFITASDGNLAFDLRPDSKGLHVTLMSRNGFLPETDFYCPLPYEDPIHMTTIAVDAAVAMGGEGLLDRLFALFIQEMRAADASAPILQGEDTLSADSFAQRYFADRAQMDPFEWSSGNLREAEENYASLRTLAWKYAILRVHEVFDAVYANFNAADRMRFDNGLKRVFIDNYAAVPHHTIHRIFALRRAGLVDIVALGPDYNMAEDADGVTVSYPAGERRFAAVIDARGQMSKRAADLPFAGLRAALGVFAETAAVPLTDGLEIALPDRTSGRVWLPAAPYLLHRRPFIQGLPGCATLGKVVATGLVAAMQQSTAAPIRSSDETATSALVAVLETSEPRGT